MRNRRTVWMSASALAAALLLASCAAGPATTTATPTVAPTTTAPPISPTKPATTTPAGAEVPKYGGTLVKSYGSDITAFDEVIGFHANPTTTMHLTNEELWTGDWAKGPAGNNHTEWEIGGLDRWEDNAGQIAESWEFPEPGTSIWHIRHGIRYALNQASEASRLVAGREVNADDVVSTLNMYITQTRAYLANQPGLKDAKITAPDKWTVQIKVQPAYHAAAILRFGGFASIVPPEVVTKYGDMRDWRVSVGTGPFILTDYVAGSSVTLKRNPTYWDKDPVGPGKGNQLPYLDEVRYLIVPDPSSTEAAFRTAKIDQFGTDWEMGPRLLKENPALKSGTNIFDGGFNTHINIKNPVFADVRVRRAMMMATDFPTMVKTLFGGTAEINTWPVTYNKAYAALFLKIEEAPASVKELYTYNPDKAKALLKEAGYPNGFKTTVVCSSSPAGNPNQVDYFSVVKNMWTKVGIDLTIEPKEPAVLTSITQSLSWTDLAYSSMGGLGTAFVGTNYSGPGFANASRVNDPFIEAEITRMVGAVATKGQNAADPIHKELMKYVLDQAYVIPFPKAPGYRLWWPWVKNYHNEFAVGYWNEGNWSKWAWIDQDMKAKMLGK
jgi:peptide/nickel transport system substrate-binding protein